MPFFGKTEPHYVIHTSNDKVHSAAELSSHN